MWSVLVDAFRACLCCSECSFYHSLTKHIFVLDALVPGHPGKIFVSTRSKQVFPEHASKSLLEQRGLCTESSKASSNSQVRSLPDPRHTFLLYIIWLSIRFVCHTTSWYMKINDRKQCIAKQSWGCFYVFANRVLGFVRHFWSWQRTLWVLIGSGCGILYRHRSGSMVWDTVWGHDLQ